MTIMIKRATGPATLFLFTILWLSSAWAHHDLVIYTTRSLDRIQPITDRYTELFKTSIKLVAIESEQLDKTIAEKKADIYLVKSINTLFSAEQADLLLSVRSETLVDNIPAHLRCEHNSWFGLSTRARAIVYNPKTVMRSELFSYAAIAGPAWEGRLCMTNGNDSYNLLLISSLIQRYGEKDTLQIVQGWANNLAVPLFKSDKDSIKAVSKGVCDVTIANHYYYTRLKQSEPNLNTEIFWPNQRGQGVHIGLSGVAIAKSTHSPEEARAFVEWLSGEEAQKLITEQNDEFPANPRVPPSSNISMLGGFRADQLPLDKLFDMVNKAREIVKEAGLQ